MAKNKLSLKSIFSLNILSFLANFSSWRATYSKTIRYLKRMFWPPSVLYPPSLEKEFIKHYAQHFAIDRRTSVALAVATWTIYFGWDLFHGYYNREFRSAFSTILLLRFAGAIFLLSAFFAVLKYGLKKEGQATLLLSLCVCVCYSILLIMIVVTPFPYNYLFYYIGLPLVMVFMFGLLRLRARTVFTLTAFCIISAGFVLPYSTDDIYLLNSSALSSYYSFAAITYLLSFALVGCAVAVELERTARTAFLRERELLKASQELSEQNSELAELNNALQEAEKNTIIKTEALVAAKEDLRKLAEQRNIEKSKFLADAAHDLRQPMQALSNLMDAAMHALERGDQQKCIELLELATDASRLARSSFNAVLDISRLESGFVETKYCCFDINELIEITSTPLLTLAKDCGVVVRIRRSTARNATVRSDPDLLSRVIGNILSNSIKYSDMKKPLKKVVIGVVCFSNRIRVDVVDNGIGIEKSKWASVFKPFVQLHNPEKDRDKGVGLGLSIVSAIVRVLEGHRLDMTSRLGKGTRFSLEIPRAEEREILTRLTENHDEFSSSNLDGSYVIYVEDDFVVRRSTIELFDQHGILYEACASLDELDAVIQGLERVPDLVITDYRLPNERNAEDVIHMILENVDEDIPLIVLTGEIISIEQQSKLRGARILQKPISSDLLLKEISSFFSD